MIGRRVHLTPSDDAREKLIRLALACRKHPTTLANELVEMCLNHPSIVEHVQQKHRVEGKFKVVVRVENGKVMYE
jgi:hypothetical protein